MWFSQARKKRKAVEALFNAIGALELERHIKVHGRDQVDSEQHGIRGRESTNWENFKNVRWADKVEELNDGENTHNSVSIFE